MAINIWSWLTGKKPKADYVQVSCADLLEAAQDFFVRDLSFLACVDMVANAIGRCEFRTYVGGKETQGHEYYTLNVEPNPNQSSTAFWHKVIYQLFTENEALVITTKTRDGRECLVCADEWDEDGDYPQKMNEYKNVVVGDVEYRKTFKENEVLHFKLNEKDLKPVLDGLALSYNRLLQAAQDAYVVGNGVHLKVHVSQLAQGTENFEANFRANVEKNLIPFIRAARGVLPEFDGYDYSNFDLGKAGTTSDEPRKIVEDIFNLTARALLIPAVLVNGTVEGTADANKRFLTYVIDPLCDQIQEELCRKRYGYDRWARGDFVRVDSSSILHFDIFENAANIEKVVGSGIFSLNDVLRAANQSPIPADWADKHYMTLNITEMGAQTRSLEGG